MFLSVPPNVFLSVSVNLSKSGKSNNNQHKHCGEKYVVNHKKNKIVGISKPQPNIYITSSKH